MWASKYKIFQVSYAPQGCIYLIKKYTKNSNNSNNVKYYYNLKELFSILKYFKM